MKNSWSGIHFNFRWAWTFAMLLLTVAAFPATQRFFAYDFSDHIERVVDYLLVSSDNIQSCFFFYLYHLSQFQQVVVRTVAVLTNGNLIICLHTCSLIRFLPCFSCLLWFFNTIRFFQSYSMFTVVINSSCINCSLVFCLSYLCY